MYSTLLYPHILDARGFIYWYQTIRFWNWPFCDLTMYICYVVMVKVRFERFDESLLFGDFWKWWNLFNFFIFKIHVHSVLKYYNHDLVVWAYTRQRFTKVGHSWLQCSKFYSTYRHKSLFLNKNCALFA